MSWQLTLRVVPHLLELGIWKHVGAFFFACHVVIIVRMTGARLSIGCSRGCRMAAHSKESSGPKCQRLLGLTDVSYGALW